MASKAQAGRAMTGKAVTRAPRDTAHDGFLNHKRGRWAKVAITLSVVAVGAYLLTDPVPRHNGGTWLGYAVANIWCYTLGLMVVAVAEPGTSLVSALLLAWI